MALTPDQLAQLHQYWANAQTNPMSTLGKGTDIGGLTYGTVGLMNTGEGGGNSYAPQTLIQYDPNTITTPGTTYNVIDPNTGNVAYTDKVQNGGSFGDLVKSTVNDLKTPVGVLGALALAGQGLPFLMGSGGAAGGAAAGLGAGAGGAAAGGIGGLAEGLSAGAAGIGTGASAGAAAGLAGLGGGLGAGALDASSYGYTNGMDAVSDAATSSGVAPAGAVNAGVATPWYASTGNVPWSKLLQQGLKTVGSSLSKQGQAQMGSVGGSSSNVGSASTNQYAGTPGYFSIASTPKPTYWSGLMNPGGNQ
jgi:hypothetical protein